MESLSLLKKISISCKNSLDIIAEPCEDLTPWCSKFGGLPYLPINTPYPTSQDGRQLQFLAQINFSELPQLDPFPSEGLLQFFIIDNGFNRGKENVEELLYHSRHEGAFGVNSENPIQQDLFKIKYIKNIDKGEILHSHLETCISDEFPIREQYRLYFVPNSASITPYTSEFYDHYKEILVNKEIGEAFEEYYTALFGLNSFNHRIGGYPAFIQFDPRYEYNYHQDKNILLLQIVSKGSIHWTGSGVSNFLISEEKLKNLDFSEVMYTFDFS